MAVSTSYSPITVAWTTSNQAISVTWQFFAASDLIVTEVSSTGVETVKSLTTLYTVSGGADADGLPSTGTVTMVGSATSGSNLRVTRSTPKTQSSTFAKNGAFPAKTVEAAFDRGMLIAQEALASAVDDITGDVLQLNSSGATDYWDGESKPLRNLADGSDTTDAVTYGQLQSVLVSAGSGNVVGAAASVDGELVLYSGTTGKALKRASTTGLLKATSGVLSAAAAGTDYAAPTTGSSVLKGNGSGGFSAAAATDLGAGRHALWIPAVAMTARTTNGAASGTTETSTNKHMLKTLDFDTTTQEFAQFDIQMPKSWNESTITAKFVWSHAATTTNFGVVWALEAVALSDQDAGDAAFGTAQQVADTGGTTNTLYVTSETSAITIAGSPAAEDWVKFQVKRVPADGSDTMGIDARLHGVTLYITTDAITDA